MMKLSFYRVLIAAGFAAGSFPGHAFADAAGSSTDSVTGYHCLNTSCNALSLPDANCICIKQNPGETNVRRLVLKCLTGHFGHWTACPVKPRYGIVEKDR
jgi:hypothetical protein